MNAGRNLPALAVERFKEEEHMKRLLKELRDTISNSATACADYDMELNEIMENRNAVAKPFTDKANELRENIRTLALVMARSCKTEFGGVSYRKGYERRTYDSKAIDNLCASMPEIKDVLWPHRKVSIVEPSVTIETW